MDKVKIYTLGCKVNSYESENIEGQFLSKGYSVAEDDFADVIIVNTCTVTAIGAKKSRQTIHKARRNNPKAIIAVAGCLPQTEANIEEIIPEADIIIGTAHKNDIVNLVEAYEGKKIVNIYDIPSEFEDITLAHNSHTRATLKIQDGCRNFCSYCIIPYARGEIRSKKIVDIVKKGELLVKNGFSEIVLVGIHLGSYGLDTGETLIDAIKQLHNIDGIRRIRLGSLEPKTVTEEFVNMMQSLPKVCNHLHLSLQSGCDKTLKLMNRKYTMEQYINCCKLARNVADMSITTDLIVGFPMETESDFYESLQNIERAKLTHMHIFPYSKREGTPAAKMSGQILNSVKSIRSKIAGELCEKLEKNFYEMFIGRSMEVLFEEMENGVCKGFTTNYIKVEVECEQNICGEYKNVLISEVCNGYVKGEIQK